MAAFSPYFVPLMLSIVISIALAVYGYIQRRHRVALYFCWVNIAITVWLGSFLAELLSAQLGTRQFFVNLSFFGIAFLPPLLLLMVAEYLGKLQELKTVVRVAFTIPAITQIIIWTNPLHSLFYGQPSLDTTTASFALTVYDYQFWFYWVHVPFAWLTLAGIFVLLIRAMRGVTTLYRNQLLLLTLAIAIPVTTDILYIAGISPVIGLDFTPVVFAVSDLLIAWALFQYKFLDLMPIARDYIFESMDDLVLIFDYDLRIIDLSPSLEKTTGVVREDVTGAHIFDAFPQYRSVLDDIVQSPDGTTEIVFDQNGRETVFSVKLSRIRDGQRVVGMMVVLRDVTSQKILARRETELALAQQRSQLQYDLITHVNHDLVTPITIIKSSLYLARKTEDETRRLAKLDTVEQNVLRLQSMLEDMLLMARIDMTHDLHCQPITLRQLFQHLIASYEAAAQNKNQRFTFHMSDDDRMLDVDQEYVAIAISRLLDNALHYAPEGGEITVTATSEASDLVITVSDDGPGISEAEQSRIFERFYRVHRHRPSDSGSGLGLAIARRIVDLHHGTITVNSTPGAGSTFTMRLPVALDASPSPAAVAELHA